MKNEKILNALDKVDEKFITASSPENTKKTKRSKVNVWVKWGAVAACLCLVAGIGVMNIDRGLSGGISESGAGVPQHGGTVPEGVDPVVASLAVIPAGVDLLDVADATSVSISEENARAVETLGNYIPNTLPEGCQYGAAGYYETTMKDGTRYHMLRITYDRGQSLVQVPKTENEENASETENVQKASEIVGDTAFLWMVWGHRPDTKLPVYQPEEVTVSLIEQQEGRVFYIDYEGVYVGVEQIDVSAEELLAVIESVK